MCTGSNRRSMAARFPKRATASLTSSAGRSRPGHQRKSDPGPFSADAIKKRSHLAVAWQWGALKLVEQQLAEDKRGLWECEDEAAQAVFGQAVRDHTRWQQQLQPD